MKQTNWVIESLKWSRPKWLIESLLLLLIAYKFSSQFSVSRVAIVRSVSFAVKKHTSTARTYRYIFLSIFSFCFANFKCKQTKKLFLFVCQQSKHEMFAGSRNMLHACFGFHVAINYIHIYNYQNKQIQN